MDTAESRSTQTVEGAVVSTDLDNKCCLASSCCTVALGHSSLLLSVSRSVSIRLYYSVLRFIYLFSSTMGTTSGYQLKHRSPERQENRCPGSIPRYGASLESFKIVLIVCSKIFVNPMTGVFLTQ